MTTNLRKRASWMRLVGQQFGEWTVIRCKGPRYGKPGNGLTWLCRCSCGTEVVVRGDSLEKGTSTCCGGVGHTYTDTPSYITVHHRVEALRGKASLHTCVDCGGPASDWSYDHSDPEPLTEITNGGRTIAAYSTDLNCFEPRCRSCHVRFDRKVKW